MKIAICGSMQFAKEMLEVRSALEELGHTSVAPKGAEYYASGEKNVENKWDKQIGDVIREWYGEIKRSDSILLVNNTKDGIENYIGGNGLIEVAFAHVLGKQIYLMNDIPKMSYTDEITAMNPVVLRGDLSKIPA